jgi:hypothetical protein
MAGERAAEASFGIFEETIQNPDKGIGNTPRS